MKRQNRDALTSLSTDFSLRRSAYLRAMGVRTVAAGFAELAVAIERAASFAAGAVRRGPAMDTGRWLKGVIVGVIGAVLVESLL
jgi:hypothetical protein